MEKDKKVAMMIAAVKALEYKKKNPKLDTEEILKKIMKEIKAEKDAKIGAIAAATRALKYSFENPDAGDKKITQMVMNDIPSLSEED